MNLVSRSKFPHFLRLIWCIRNFESPYFQQQEDAIMESTPPKDTTSFQENLTPRKLRKPSGLDNRKGLPLKYNPNSVIDDEEYLLSQTPSKPGHLNSSEFSEKQIESTKVQKFFNAEYFYS